jgi:hypothetical protein
MRMTHTHSFTPLITPGTVKLVGTSVTEYDYMNFIKVSWDLD